MCNIFPYSFSYSILFSFNIRVSFSFSLFQSHFPVQRQVVVVVVVVVRASDDSQTASGFSLKSFDDSDMIQFLSSIIKTLVKKLHHHYYT